MPRSISLDIGSTYTKGALLDVTPGRPRLLRREAVPTTVDRLSDGVANVLARLLDLPELNGARPDGARPSSAVPGSFTQPRAAMLHAETAVQTITRVARDIPLFACSSAKGGLNIAAVGIVPDLTLQAARLASASAGGKVVAHYAYYLTRDQIAELERMRPDIVLLCGGTDGGNEQYNMRNARAIAESSLGAAILYAGNAAIRGEIEHILSGKELMVTENLMPEVGKLHIEPAQACIREIFLRRIVEGKGLSELSACCAAPLKPTPRAVFDLLGVLGERRPEWNDSVWVDLGGATTDFYSCTESFHGEPSYVLRGLLEPRLKRTVEGDLGMRVNARSVLDAAGEYLRRELTARNGSLEQLADYAAACNAEKERLPGTAAERWFDELLAGACLYHALWRHAGVVEECYSPHGKVYVQRGKDLRAVRRWIGGGGYLARLQSAALYRNVLAAIERDSGGLRLIPQPAEYFTDADYLLSLLGNLTETYPAEAAQLASEHLQQLPINM